MEKIKERSMTTLVMSSFINLGIGVAFGLIVGIIATIATDGSMALRTMLYIPLGIAVFVALFATNMYRVYFYYRLSLDVDKLCEGDGEESESYLISLVLGFLTFGMYNVFWLAKLAKRMRANAPKYGFKMLETGKEIAVLDVFSFGFISAWELIKNINRMAVVYNGDASVGGVQ